MRLDWDGLERKIQKRRDDRRKIVDHPSIITRKAIPDTFEDWLPHVKFPHIDEMDEGGMIEVCAADLNAVQRLVLARFPLGQLRENGAPVPYRLIFGKARRVFFTSLVFALWLFYSVRFQRTKWMSLYHLQKQETIRPQKDQINYSLLKMPREWVGDPVGPATWFAGNTAFIGPSLTPNLRSTWALNTAGHSESTASDAARSGFLNGLHMSEVRQYRHAGTVWAAADKTVNR